jgi:hypothetical protein
MLADIAISQRPQPLFHIVGKCGTTFSFLFDA